MWKEKQKMETEEKEFYHKQALDAKRKNKLLKVAIGRLQTDTEKKAIEYQDDKEKEKDTDTFITGTNIDPTANIDNIENAQAIVEQNMNNSQSRRRGVTQSQQFSQSSKGLHNRTKS